jgi:hypothetical protein
MLHLDAIPPKTRRHLSFDPLIRQIRLRAKLFPDTRDESNCSYFMAGATAIPPVLMLLFRREIVVHSECGIR